MEIKKIEYEVAKSGITPATSQPAGVQGDDNATKLSFVFSKELLSELDDVRQKTGGRILYRFDSIDASGFTDKSDVEVLGNETKSVEFSITRKLTMFGGTAKVYLCLTLEKEDKTLSELFSFPAILYFSPRPGAEYEQAERESLSTLARIAKESCITAVESKEAAEEAQEKTELAKQVLEQGSIFVFDGGNAENNASLEYIIDNTWSENSLRPVQNKIINKRFNDIKSFYDSLEDRIEELETKIDDSGQAIDILKAVYPVGSIYITLNDENPTDLFGGKWEKIEARFLIASGGPDSLAKEEGEYVEEYNFEIGSRGGSYKHKLGIDEMPSHSHEIKPSHNFTVSGGGRKGTGISGIKGGISGWGSYSEAHWFSVDIRDAGGNKSHNNLPPYLVVNMWKRVADEEIVITEEGEEQNV